MRFLLFCAVFSIHIATYKATAARQKTSIAEEIDMELESQLKILSKPPIKSFREKNGRIVDCIDIRMQPAFDHPLLQNHTIQMKPSSIPGRIRIPNSVQHVLSKREGVNCPLRTVPIQRVTKEDLIRIKNLPPKLHHPNIHASSSKNGRYYFAVAKTVTPSHFYGTTAYISVYNVPLSLNQFSEATVWLLSGAASQLNSIQYGWAVNPNLFGDDLPHLIGHWTADGNKKTGCYNLLCPGFVQVSSKHYLGEVLERQSTYGGTIYAINPTLFKDPKTGNWWVAEYLKEEGFIYLGYWPNSIFTSLKDTASNLQFGGETYSPSYELPPPMGSGHFEPPDFKRTCFASEIQLIDEATNPYMPSELLMELIEDHPKCYQVDFLGDTGYNGYAVQFGGSGGSSCTP